MWYKIKELEKAGLNKTQIGKEIGIHRKTVRGYLRLSEEEFYKKLEEVKLLPKKLQEYYEYVRELLERYPYISASQVEDRLKENYSKLPQVHSKTVYNFVESIRKRHDIKKQKDKAPRQYEKLAETEYGEYGQVDFGEYQMLTQGSGRKKIHFCNGAKQVKTEICIFSDSPLYDESSSESTRKRVQIFWRSGRKDNI
jgi:transposase